MKRILRKVLSAAVSLTLLLMFLPPAAAFDSAGWNCVSPQPNAGVFSKIEFIDGKYMAIGYDGLLCTSPDGVIWQKVNMGNGVVDRLTDITYGEGKYVIVGITSSDYLSRIFTSDDGLNWHESAAITGAALYSAVYGGGKFVAAGSADKVMISEDGETWVTVATNPMDYAFYSLTYADGRFIGAGGRRHTGVTSAGGIMSSPDGVTWTLKHTSVNATLWDITCGKGCYVAVGGQSNSWGSRYICSSPDGEVWTERSVAGELSSSARLYSVIYDGIRFVAAGATTGNSLDAYVATSGDGITWTYQQSAGTPGFSFVASNAAGTRLVAVGSPGNIYASDDGAHTWIRQTVGTTKTLTDAAWSGSVYVAVGYQGTIQSSTDGINWTVRQSNTTNDLNQVEFAGGSFIAVGKNGTIVTSIDGINWTVQSSGTTQGLKAIAYGAGRFIVTGGSGFNPVMLTSTDGAAWSPVIDPNLYGVAYPAAAYGDGVFLALTEYGSAVRSADGLDWEQVSSIPGSGHYITAMTYGAGKFVAVGGYGEVYLTADKGAVWTVVETDQDTDSNDNYLDSYSTGVAYGDGKFIVVGERGKILASGDGGLTWYAQPNELMCNLYSDTGNTKDPIGVTAGDRFVVVGGTGVVVLTNGFATFADSDMHNVILTKMGNLYGNLLGGEAFKITADISLPTGGINGTSVSWQSSKPAYIASDGKVTRPGFAAGDQAVVLTAVITKGDATDVRSFITAVKAWPNPDIQAVNEAFNALTFDTIKGSNTAQNSITSNLTLAAAGLNSTSVAWASSDTAAIATDGTVTRPAAGQPDKAVTLTATITKGSASQTKSFDLTVKALQNADALDVAVAKDALTFSTIKAANSAENNILSDLNLVTTGENEVSISWASSSAATIAVNGAVTRPAAGAGDAVVTLTATISKGAATDTKLFSLTVKQVSATPVPNGDTYAYMARVSSGAQTFALPIGISDGGAHANVVLGTYESGILSGGGSLSIDMPVMPNASEYSVKIPRSALSGENKSGKLWLNTKIGSVIIPSNMLSGLTAYSGSMVEICLGKGGLSLLSAQEKGSVGSRPLVWLTFMIDGVKIPWENAAAPVSVHLPYVPTAEERLSPDSIIIWETDGAGDPVCVPGGRYDAKSGMVCFEAKRSGIFGVGFNRVSFSDVAENAWYAEAVSFIAAREITFGTGNNSYNPRGKLTRAEFLVMLMRAYDIAPSENLQNNFTDAGNTYYTGYLAAAKLLGIAKGVGNNCFAPDKEISREEMFTLLSSVLKLLGKQPAVKTGASVSDYPDAAQISPWAKEAVTLLVETGMVQGSGGKLNPAGSATRAEMAQLLYNLIIA